MGLRTQIIQMLGDTHILIVDDSPERDLLVRMFTALGANVHHAESQMQAVGMYFRLYRQRCIPRAVICDWYLSSPESGEHKFMAKYMPSEVERNTTSLILLENIRDLEPDAFCSVYTRDAGAARQTLASRGLSVEVYDKGLLSVADFVSTIAEHETIAQQRVAREQVASHLRTVQSEMESGAYPALRHRSA